MNSCYRVSCRDAYPASAQTYEQLIAGGRTDVHLGQKKAEINETFRKLFR
jgi:hypothetical protein